MTPTKAQRELWERMRELGCCVDGCGRYSPSIHHIGTGMGGRKDHDQVIPICFDHHQGVEGIHTIGRRLWQKRHGTEQELLAKTLKALEE